MPKSDDEIEVVFFNVGKRISQEDLEKENEKRGLVSVDLFILFTVNEVDATFCIEYPNGTQWKNEQNEPCWGSFSSALVFDGSDEKNSLSCRKVCVHQGDENWYENYWLGGFRK